MWISSGRFSMAQISFSCFWKCIGRGSWLESLCNTSQVLRSWESELLLTLQMHVSFFILSPVRWCDLPVVEALQLKNMELPHASASQNRWIQTHWEGEGVWCWVARQLESSTRVCEFSHACAASNPVSASLKH